jgi:hypothetical protein
MLFFRVVWQKSSFRRNLLPKHTRQLVRPGLAADYLMMAISAQAWEVLVAIR